MEEVLVSYMLKIRKISNHDSLFVAIWKRKHTQWSDWV